MKSQARWLTVAAVAWAFVVTSGLYYVVLTSNANSGTDPADARTYFQADGIVDLVISAAPFVWILITATVAWLASRKRSYALSILAGVLALIFGTLCALTLLAVFTPLPMIGLAFGVSAMLLLIAIFTERADIKAERKQDPAVMQPSTTTQVTSSPNTPTAP